MPRVSASVYRRRRVAVFGSASVALALVASLGAIGLAPLPSAAVTSVAATDLTNAPAQLALPPFGTTVISADGYGILAEQNADVPVPIASMAKVITALVVLEAQPIANGESGANITFDAEDVNALTRSIENAESRADVIEGMTLSEKDALTVMLVKSANNYAWSLARWAFGSEEAYVSAANDWLARNGLHSTVVVDASGLSPATQGTPRDLVTLGALALNNEVTAVAVGTATTTIDPLGEIENSNKLLGTLGIDGIKTGTTDEAGSCLLYSANLPVGDSTVRVIGVTLGAPDHPTLDDALVAFLTSVQGGFHVVTPTTAGLALATATTQWGSSTPLLAADTTQRIVWSDTPVTVTLPGTTAPTGGTNDVAGTATVTFGTDSVSVPLVRGSDLPEPGMAWRVSHLEQLVAG